MTSKRVCPICKTIALIKNTNSYRKNIECDRCGIISAPTGLLDLDINKLASFLFYNNVLGATLRSKDGFYYLASSADNDFEDIKTKYPKARLLMPEEVEAWYPKNFSEKIDCIMLGLNKLSKFDGDAIILNEEQGQGLFFIKRFNDSEQSLLDSDIYRQEDFIIDYLEKQGLIEAPANGPGVDRIKGPITILPAGLARIDELQKYQVNNKQAFVAIAFSADMDPVRNAIRKALEQAGYIMNIMDEKEHNNQIVPEMLYDIRQSKFVIAELSEHNNGVYYEAGYAAGLGKEVIHVCRKETFNNSNADSHDKKKVHFDVQQKNTIIWETPEELTICLCARIKATVD